MSLVVPKHAKAYVWGSDTTRGRGGGGGKQESPSSMTAGFMEHKRLFGYQPSKGTKGKGSAIGKKGKGHSVRQQKCQATWRKDCICLGQ